MVHYIHEIGDTCLAELRQEKALPRPLLLGNNASCETHTESMNMDPVRETRSASLFLIGGVDIPFNSWPHSVIDGSKV